MKRDEEKRPHLFPMRDQENARTKFFESWNAFKEKRPHLFTFKMQNYSTQYSRVVPHHSTDWAITSLTSEIRRVPVCSSVYGRSWK